MRASLSEREPEALARWEQIDLYGKVRTAAAGRPQFVFCDGPPYANGDIHIGHAVNKILKDIVIRSRTLSGFDAPFVPAWDCHGLPIEHAVEKKLGRKAREFSRKEFRDACRKYAEQQVERQRSGFKRLGVLADWDRSAVTMDPAYEACEIEAFATLFESGYVVRRDMPVHWCLDCRSALAEAEVEYYDTESPAIDVAFRVVDNAETRARFGVGSSSPIAVPIWTTTPWTLPANQAVAINPDFDYVLVDVTLPGGPLALILADGLMEAVLKRYGASDVHQLGRVRGQRLEQLRVKHPWLNREVPLLPADHVTLEMGTGAVHTAPAHGQDDYRLGSQFGLPVEHPVCDDGRFAESTPIVGGSRLREANEQIIEELKHRSALLACHSYKHSYPHCWRHKTPLIFRATPQWFIDLSQGDLREHTLDAVTRVNWTPKWGEGRMRAMIEGRPDWCISRQRVWGVPIALFVHRQTGKAHPDSVRLLREVARRVREGGLEAWDDLDPKDLIGDDAKLYSKSEDVLDVWLDSGLMHRCVTCERENLGYPSDLYLEGSDQHRGWFQSSLLTGMALNQDAPYRAVLTHGFAVDADGKKMSKSLGNVIAPQKVVDTLGADVLRLWVAATDYRREMSVSQEILKRTAEAFRRMRNTLRFLVSNLYDFDPGTDSIPGPELLGLDAWLVSRARELGTEIEQAYSACDFHLIYQKINNFCVSELGSLFLDIVKDRLYTMKSNSHGRRSAQTALAHTAEALSRWLAPILCFTAEEVYEQLPGQREHSIMLTTWYEPPEVHIEQVEWANVFALRGEVMWALEQARREGTVKGSLDATVTLYLEPSWSRCLQPLGDEARFLFLVSEVTICEADARPESALSGSQAGVWVTVSRSSDEKCVRCWHRRPEVGSQGSHPQLCARCIDNLEGAGEQRRWA